MMRYFDQGEFTDLIQYDLDKHGSETVSIIKDKHKDGDLLKEVQSTPSNVAHLKFLEDHAEGVTNHGLLFSEQEEISLDEEEDLQEKIRKDLN